MNNLITAGEKAKKIHIWNGSKTLCNRKSLYTENKKQFLETVVKYPDLCCDKCLSKLMQIK